MNRSEKTFMITGTYRETGEPKKFSGEIIAVNENYAKEKALSQIGSRHHVKRHAIKIESVAERK